MRNLLKFADNFEPLISPIILHGDDDIGINAAIIYHAHSKRNERMAPRPLLDFCFRNSREGRDIIVWGKFLIKNAKYSLFDIELNSIMGLERADAFIRDFSQYLIDLYNKGIKL